MKIGINKFSDMSDAYISLSNLLLSSGNRIGNTRECNNVQFTLENPKNNIAATRSDSEYGISLSYALGELVWYLSGDNTTEFIGQFGSLWKRISDNGVTNNSAYGYVIEKQWGFNQLDLMYNILSGDPDSRRAVININTPHRYVIETKDEPCTISLQFFIRNNKLNMTTVMRSNDIWFGTPYDVIYFTTLQQILAARLGIEVGTYTHFAGSFHVYDRNLEDLKNVQRHYNEDNLKTIDVLKLYDDIDAFKRELLSMDGDIKKNIVDLAKKNEII